MLSAEPLTSIFLVATYAFIGGGIKYIDQAYDIGIFDKKIALLLAVITGILMGSLIATDQYSAIIFLGIVLSVAITRKIDSPAFYLGVLIVLAAPLAYLFLFQKVNLNWLPFVIIVISGIIDEIGNDMADVKKISGVIQKFFAYRFSMKIAVLLLALFAFLPILYLVAFLAFDVSYALIDSYSLRELQNAKRVA